MRVQNIFYQFLRFQTNFTIWFINGNFLKLLVLTQVSMGVIITSVRPVKLPIPHLRRVNASPTKPAANSRWKLTR